ncbi:MAG TPA: hypothetical protein VHO03_18520 [Ignavibacteriales bacterium]|nr:hypothetical protein [Ignavibacteriales bacterium]
MLNRLLLITLFLLAFILPLSAQEKDSTDIWDDWGDEESAECTSHDHDFEFMPFHSFGGKPTIELTYGNSEIGMKSFGKLSQRGFANAGSAELRLSYSSLDDYDDYLVKYKNHFFFVSNNSTDLVSKENAPFKINSNLWRFGFGTQEGYGYKIGSSAIVPYTSNSFVWSRVEWNMPTYAGNLPALAAEDQTRLDLFNNAFRFGTMAEGGIKVQLVPLFTLNAGYEKSVIFPRYLVWKQLGSFIVEGIAQGAVSMFAGEVMDSSPAAGPVVNFLLKSGVSYAIYQLRREKMNWPFNSAEPLTYDTWKVGMTFTF